MLVHVDGLVFPADFVVVDMNGDICGSVIRGDREIVNRFRNR